MRLIRKGAEPPLLLAYRKTTGARYDGLPTSAKSELREALVKDQHGLCCFCMQRIEATVTPSLRVKIAHWMPQQADRTRDLEWSNLFAACPGNEGAPRAKQHCDTRQGDRVLRISPSEPSHVATLSYTARGEIRTSRDDLRRDIDDSLNLNEASLCTGRREAVLRMVGALRARQKGDFTAAGLRAALARSQTPDESGQLPPFAGALHWWLKRRLGESPSPGRE